MTTPIKEMYQPVIVGVNSTMNINGNQIAGFLCVTSGTVTVTVLRDGGSTLFSALPVIGGTYYPMPFYIGYLGGTITTASGASGVLGV